MENSEVTIDDIPADLSDETLDALQEVINES